MSNGATGTATVDLRDLGPKRTLVLINGRRLVPGDPNSASQAADLNFIPSALIKRVDVLTGGASSVYGADAVAGVVNFIMDTGFTGHPLRRSIVLLSAQQRLPEHPGAAERRKRLRRPDGSPNQGLKGYAFPRGSVADGGSFDGTVSIGAAFDDSRGHAMAYFGYRKVNPMLQRRRDYAPAASRARATSPAAVRRLRDVGNTLITVPRRHPAIGTSTFFTFGPNRTLVPGTSLYNFNPTNYFQRPDERYTAGAFADYEISPAVHPYMEFMFMNDHTLAQIAPSGDFGNTFTINCDNPLTSAQARGVVCSPGNVINGFLGNLPAAAGRRRTTRTRTAPPVAFVDARRQRPTTSVTSTCCAGTSRAVRVSAT